MYFYFTWKNFWLAMLILFLNPVGIVLMVVFPFIFFTLLIGFILSLIFVKDWD